MDALQYDFSGGGRGRVVRGRVVLAAAALALLASGAAAALRLSEASEIWRVSFQASDVS